jgi:uncharacterized membrane protein YhaH (DUF805 family)
MNIFKNIFNFKGRSIRKEFITYAVAVYSGRLFTKDAIESIYEKPIEGLLALLFLILLLLPAPALIARRLNDGGYSLKCFFYLIVSVSIWGMFASCAQFLFAKRTLVYDICIYTSIGAALVSVILCLLIFIFCIARKSRLE